MSLSDIFPDDGRQTVSKGDIIKLSHRNTGTFCVVVPYEQCSADAWNCVIVGGDDTVYPQGGYNIVVRTFELSAGMRCTEMKFEGQASSGADNTTP